MSGLRERLARLKAGTEDLNYGREVVTAMGLAAIAGVRRPARVLDLGMGSGIDLTNLRQGAGPDAVSLFGIDVDAGNTAVARDAGITAVGLDIERERFPFDDQFFDLVIANQVIEHTKEIFWIFSETSRVLRRGGGLVIGVPNLASLHNRMLLAFGQQPSAIHVLGAHVRGFTRRGLEEFIEADGYFRVVEARGSNFYPFPPAAARPLSRWLPSLAVGLFVRCERTGHPGVFGDVLRTRRLETPYFVGEGGNDVVRPAPP
jgi:SAM-dependent methyltransferase